MLFRSEGQLIDPTKKMLGVLAAPSAYGTSSIDYHSSGSGQNTTTQRVDSFLQPCCSHGCPLDSATSTTAKTSPAGSLLTLPGPATAPLLLDTASTARWRRKGRSLGNIDTAVIQKEQ